MFDEETYFVFVQIRGVLVVVDFESVANKVNVLDRYGIPYQYKTSHYLPRLIPLLYLVTLYSNPVLVGIRIG